MRKRSKAVTIRLSQSEYNDLKNRIDKAGLLQQTYIINAIRGATITPSDEIIVLKEISLTLAQLEQQLRGLATNVNQMAHIANGHGSLPSSEELDRLSTQLSQYRMESEEIWQSIRSSINQQKVTEQ